MNKIKTKDKIVITALNLFNHKGLSQVTLRTIAQEMGISQGNLNYHFKKREEIIETLYFQLVESIDKGIVEHEEENNLQSFFQVFQVIMDSFYTYRFFLLDFVQIMREHKKIKIHYAQLNTIRTKQFQTLFATLIANDIIRKEELPHEYEYLYKRLQILIDFWISGSAIAKERLSKKTVPYYYEVIGQSLYPYLTPKGKTEYILAMKIKKA